MEFPGGSEGWGFGTATDVVLVTDVAQIQFLAREIPHAMGVAPPKKRERERRGEKEK